jgi:two-component system, NtrC family, nitrogen regulation response regulator NtrX
MSGRILVIDDHEGVRETLRSFLVDHGHEVHLAADGETGLATLREVAPNLLFLDIFMPGVSGLEVIRRIRAVDTVIPVVMITGVDDDEIARDLLLAGATDFIRKPLRLDYVKRVVDACLAKVRPADRHPSP